MMKRILSLLLALLMVVSILPVSTFADDIPETPTEAVTEPSTEPTEPSTEPSTEPACAICGANGCTSEHLTWCPECKKDDCGVDHVSAAEVDLCETCGTVDCTKEHKSCETCGTVDCTKEHKSCETCGTVDCTKEHKTCETCGTVDCTADHTNWCDTCKKDNCSVDHAAELPRVPMTSTGPKQESSTVADEVHPMVGKIVTLNTEWPTAIPDVNNVSNGNMTSAKAYPEHMEIEAVATVNNVGYYQLKAAPGYTWPDYVTDMNAGTTVNYEHYWIEASKVKLVEENCPVCGKPGCTAEHIQCDKCGEYDCTKLHFWCDRCDTYDCGKFHLICPVPDCGKVDCTENHTFCPHCGIYDCGIEHEDEYKPDTAPVIPNNPTLTPNADVSIVDEYGDAVTAEGLFLEDGTKTSISAWPVGEADSYQWQICYNNANDLWANIQGETGKGILISPAMFLNIISYQGTAAIRCVATVGGETKVSASIPVTVMEAVPQQEMMMFAARPGGENEAAPTADVEYSIVIDYKFRDGSKAATSWTASLAHGADYILDVESPAVVGYKPDQARITETITNFTGTRIITVYYDPDIVEFKVIHHQQNITGNEYTVYRTDTKQGYTGTQVGTDLQESFTGFDQLNYDETLVIAADGSTVVNIYYDREYYIVRLNLNGGFGSEPICARYGTPVNITDPQRTGYAFAGWSPALPTFVEKETSHTAQWTKANTDYTVAFWYENANDNGYTFVGSSRKTGTTGTQVSGSLADYTAATFDGKDATNFKRLNADKTDKNVTIKADGTTVVNVYIYRETYKLTYYMWECLHTHTNACCNLQHIHTTACCSKTPHTHSTSCCSIHVHTMACLNSSTNGGYEHCAKSSFEKKCWDAYPEPVNGQTYSFWNILANRYFVYFDGYWWQVKDNSTYGIEWGSCGGNPQPPHAHGSGCNTNGCGLTPHTHGDGSCNTSKCGKTAHDHSSGKLASCNSDGCSHTPSWHCESDTTNPDHWKAVYSEYLKYEAYTDQIHWDMLGMGDGVPGLASGEYGLRWVPQKYGGFAHWNGDNAGNGTAVGAFTSMTSGDVNFYQGGTGSNQYEIQYWLEGADGTGSRAYTKDGDTRYFNAGTLFKNQMGNVAWVDEFQHGTPLGFEQYEATYGATKGADTYVLAQNKNQSAYKYNNFYYVRKIFKLEYRNGETSVTTRDMRYEQPMTGEFDLKLSELNAAEQGNMVSPYGSGYVFGGWYMDPDGTIPAKFDGSTIMPNAGDKGTIGLALYAKWVPITHKITTYQTKNGTKINTYSITHGQTVSGTVNKPTNGKLNFVGWFYEENGEKKAYDFSMPVYKDMELYAEWTSDVQVSGTITYIDRATGKALAQSSPISGQVGATKTYEAKVGTQLNSTGYFPEVTSHNIEFSANASQNDWIFYYNAMKDVAYEVRYINPETGAAMAAAETGTTNEPTLTFKAKTFKGYSADAYEKTLIVSSDEKLNVVIFYYTEDTIHAPVQVVHYIQNTTGDGYNRYLTEEPYQGIIGETQSKVPLTITGFTYNELKSKNGINLTEDGLQLELYYDRNTYNYEFRFEDPKGETLRTAVKGSGLYGSLAEYTADSIPGYRLTTAGTQFITITEKTDNNVKIFVYEERTATIRYEVGSVNGGSVTPASESVPAVSGTAEGSVAEAKTNYTFAGWYTDYACSDGKNVGNNAKFIPGKTADDVYVDATYYAKFEEIKVTLHYQVEMPENATGTATLTKESEQVSIYTGRATGSSVDKVPYGYQFEGWYDADGNKLTGNTAYTPPRTDEPWQDGTTYYARFVEKKATLNYVAVGNGAVSPGTEEVSMVTGTASGATATATENIAQFVGWYDNAACEGAALSTDATFAPALPSGGWAETQTYYAKFENIEYTITFEDRGSTVKTQSYVYGDTLTLPEVTNGNYAVSWMVKESSGDWDQDTRVENGVINHYGNVTLVANWTITAIWIDHDFNIVTSDDEDFLWVQEDVPFGDEPEYQGLATEELAARRNDEDYTYTFHEWVVEDLSGYETLLGDEIKGVVIYRASYTEERNSYTITYDPNGGSEVTATEYTTGTAFALAAAPERAGYQFDGWVLSEPAGSWEAGTYDAGQEIDAGMYGDITLKAAWKRQTGNLLLDYNGDGTPVVVTITCTEAAEDSELITIKTVITADTTIANLPTGRYNVTAEPGRGNYSASAAPGKIDIISGETEKADVTVAAKTFGWLTGFDRETNRYTEGG